MFNFHISLSYKRDLLASLDFQGHSIREVFVKPSQLESAKPIFTHILSLHSSVLD